MHNFEQVKDFTIDLLTDDLVWPNEVEQVPGNMKLISTFPGPSTLVLQGHEIKSSLVGLFVSNL